MNQMIPNGHPPRFAVCVRNDGYELDLALHRRYEVLPDPSAERSGWIRVVDETGEDYLYPAKYFRPSGSAADAERPNES
ncbi:MAG TPA: hypothetical protein VGC13_07110 [Longimicrobium sp.]|jgi:hypothetical protein|uniref:hypothetical protein n=1 Tax=Longimicrobium sp. TaxID=2029185 RepID=UPI002ED7A382